MVKVSKEQFDAFLANYPRPLQKHLTTICDPEMLGFYDFSLGTDADSALVAKQFLFDAKDPRVTPGMDIEAYYIRVGG